MHAPYHRLLLTSQVLDMVTQLSNKVELFFCNDTMCLMCTDVKEKVMHL